MDQDQMESVKVFDPVHKCHYRVLVPQKAEYLGDEAKGEDSDQEEEIIYEEVPVQNITTWSRTETLALINIFSLFKDTFKDFKKRKEQWNLISEELAKIGIHKLPEKCEIKWKNLLRVYRQHKNSNTGQGKFEFFNELDDIVANDPQFKYIAKTSTSGSNQIRKKGEVGEEQTAKVQQLPGSKKRKCFCEKSEKQKRHEDRMALMAKKLEIEERKVKAFEEYLEFLKSSIQNNCLTLNMPNYCK